MRLPYQLFGGGTMGDGKQWVSWVHIDDLVELFLFALTTASVEGPLNITAPHPETMRRFGQTIGKVLHRPHWLPAPRFALELALGEKVSSFSKEPVSFRKSSRKRLQVSVC
ncbi:NAD-dependent epimerase/dehydratase family protein [Exiguobacterium artemiae]